MHICSNLRLLFRGIRLITAQVRNTQSATSPSLALTLKVPQGQSNGNPVPALQNTSVTMIQQSTVGLYNIYSATYALDPSQAQNTKFDVSVGSFTDSFKNTGDLGTTCGSLSGVNTTSSSVSSSSATKLSSSSSTASTTISSSKTTFSSVTISSTKSSSSLPTSTSSKVPSSTSVSSSSSSTLSISISSSKSSSSTKAVSTSTSSVTKSLSSSTSAPPAVPTNPVISGYTYSGCYNDSTIARVLSGPSNANDSMTVENCASFCKGTTYFGVEYGRECYCGATLRSTSTKQPATDCYFKCAGNPKEYCGAGNRLNIYIKS